jgi:hypothetical protein
MKCPGFERLIDYLDGQLSADQSKSVTEHLASGCGKCEASRLWYEHVRAIAASDESVDPPSWVTRRACQLFDRGLRPNLIQQVGNIIASLLFDSFAQPAVAGVRSTETTSRQLLYSADAYSIDLQISPSDKASATVMGQILHKDDLRFESVSKIPLSLVQGGEAILSTVTNEAGEFVLTEIDCGEYDLLIDTRDMCVTVTGLPVIQMN